MTTTQRANVWRQLLKRQSLFLRRIETRPALDYPAIAERHGVSRRDVRKVWVEIWRDYWAEERAS